MYFIEDVLQSATGLVLDMRHPQICYIELLAIRKLCNNSICIIWIQSAVDAKINALHGSTLSIIRLSSKMASKPCLVYVCCFENTSAYIKSILTLNHNPLIHQPSLHRFPLHSYYLLGSSPRYYSHLSRENQHS